jgi:cytochrome c oxidase subunit 2
MIEYLGKLSDHLGLPVDASSHGFAIDMMLGWVHWVMFILFAGWGLYLIITVIKFNSKINPKADYNGVQSHYSKYAEIGIIVIEAFLLVGLSIPLWSQLRTTVPGPDEAIQVRVIAQQFAWNIHYPGADGEFGNTDIQLVDEESNPIGLVREGNGADDIVTLNQLHLPVNQQVLIHLSSKDVIHGFGIPEMRVKQDALPGMTIPVYFTPTMTSAEFLDEIKGSAREGKGFEIACAQLCGNSHYRMRGFLTVESEDEFNGWLEEEAEYLEEGDDDDW